MSYTPLYARQVAALRKEMGCETTDDAIEMLEQAVIELREVYENPPKLRKTEVHPQCDEATS